MRSLRAWRSGLHKRHAEVWRFMWKLPGRRHLVPVDVVFAVESDAGRRADIDAVIEAHQPLEFRGCRRLSCPTEASELVRVVDGDRAKAGGLVVDASGRSLHLMARDV